MEDSESLRQSPEKLSSAVSGLAEGTVNAAVAAISAVFPQVGILLTFGLATAQGRQAEQFSRFVQKSFANIEQSKLDRNYLRSQEFLELLLAASHEVDRTLSEQNHRALANALANSSLLGESLKPGNRAILRCLGQMSADEILALSVIAQESDSPTYV
jgi:soluble lytic murein transglycosylase-like protein